MLVSARPRSNTRTVWHLDEFVVPNVRSILRVHLFPTDFTLRQTVILGHSFVVPNLIYRPAVGALKSFRHLKNIFWLGVGVRAVRAFWPLSYSTPFFLAQFHGLAVRVERRRSL